MIFKKNILIIFIFIIGISLWLLDSWKILPNKKIESLPNKLTVPEISLVNLHGDKVGLNNFLGKVVILDFWATWCGPCRKELVYLNKLYKKYKQHGLEVIGISLDRKNGPEIEKFLKDLEVEFLNLMGGEKTLEVFSNLPGLGPIKGIPAIFIIDRQGQISHRFIGLTEEKAIEEVIKALL